MCKPKMIMSPLVGFLSMEMLCEGECKMSIKEAERLSAMRQIDKKILTIKRAREEFGISERQTKLHK